MRCLVDVFSYKTKFLVTERTPSVIFYIDNAFVLSRINKAHKESDTLSSGRVSCKFAIYVSEAISGLFISFDTLIRLQIVTNR